MFAFFASFRNAPSLCLIAVMALPVLGCGQKDPEAAQIVAKVDGGEINLRQLNALVAKADGVTAENISELKLAMLGTLVEQQLAVNLAISNKLDRKPEIVNAIDASRRKILAQAALDQIAADLAVVGEEEAKRYYAEHPELFSERRIFTVQELNLNKSAATASQIRAQLASAKRLDDVAAWLKEKKVEFNTSASTKAAEQIRPEILSKLRSFKDGQIGVFETAEGIVVTRLVSSADQPVPLAKGLPTIQAMLARQRAADAVKDAKTEMRTKAELEYFGEFAGAEAAFKSGMKAKSRNTAADEEAQSNARAKADAHIVEQGIKGL